MLNQEQHQERVLKVLERYKEPRSVDQIAITAGLKEADARWACEVLKRKGQLTIVAGGEYTLVLDAPEAPKKQSKIGRGDRRAQVLSLMEDGETWTSRKLSEAVGITQGNASQLLSHLHKGEKIEKVAWGQYRALGPKQPEEEKPQFKLTTPPVEDPTEPTVTVTMTVTATGVTMETAARMLGILSDQEDG